MNSLQYSYRSPSAAPPGNSQTGAATETAAGPPIKSGFAWVTSVKRTFLGQAVSQQLLLVMTSQLASMLAAGCDLCAGLDAVSEQEAHPTLKRILVDLRQRVEGGQSLSQALASHPEVFSNLYVTMVRAGESAGLLKHMLHALQLIIQNQKRIVNSVRAALMYPFILMIVAIGAIVIMTTFVLPRFAVLFEQSNVPLPAITRFVIHTSKYVSNHFVSLILASVGLAVAAVWLVHHPAIRPALHKWVLKIPLLGKTMQLAYVCRSIQSMGMLLKAGLPLSDVLVLTRDMMPNLYYWQFFNETRQHLNEGRPLSADFDATTLFPRMTRQMVAVGERTGTMPQVCLEIAAFHEEVLQRRIKVLATALEPLIILIMGAFVGFIAVSVIVPMFRLSSTVH